MKKLLFMSLAVISTAFAEKTQDNNNANCVEFLAGVNSGVSTSWYDIPKEGVTINGTIPPHEIKIWNATKVRKSKYFMPFIEAELSGQYLIKRCIVGASIAGGMCIGGKYTQSGHKDFGCNNGVLQALVDNNLSKREIQIAKQKYHWFIAPYVGYRMDNNNDIYLTGGLKMVATKYFGSKTKCTWHPVIGFGARYWFKDNIFVKVEYNYVLPKKKRLSDTMRLIDGGNHYHDLKAKVAVKHGESVLRLGVGYKFR